MNFAGLRPGHHRLACPECSGSRRNRTGRPLSVEVDSTRILWHCHHCGYKGSEARFPKEVENYVTEVENHTDIHEGYLFGRGISRKIADRYGVGGAFQYVREAGTKVNCLEFPYYSAEGARYGNKYRSTTGKGFSCSAPLKDLWRIDLIDLAKSEDIIICEGEIDALSIAEAGFDNCVSIPNGAAASQSDAAYGYIWEAKDKIEAAKRIILAGDSDKPGEANQEEIARRIGKYRVWRVVWPTGVKDANDALISLGIDKLRELVRGAEPWPVSGLYGAEHFFPEVRDIYQNGLDAGASTGYPVVDEIYTVAPGLLTIVTGWPGAGKSEVVDQLMCNLAEREGWKFAICSFENPPPLHIIKLASKRARLSAWDHRIETGVWEEALGWIDAHFSFLYHSDGSLSDLDSILDRLRVAVMRYGIRGCVIDPYNYIRRAGEASETDWVSDILTKLKTFCMAHGVHCWFIAHPTKMRRLDDGTIGIPDGNSISGSAHFFNKADVGLTVHREENSAAITHLKIWKMRFSWQGKCGKAALIYDSISTTYSDGTIQGDDPLLISASEEDAGYA